MSDDEALIHLKNDFAWVIDPIDGTNNFALGFPLCAISLALLYRGTPIYGFVYDYSTQSLIEGGEDYALRINEKVFHTIRKHERRATDNRYSISPEKIDAHNFKSFIRKI